MSGGQQRKRDENRESLPQAASPPGTAGDEVSSDMLSEIVAQTASDLVQPKEVDPALRAAMVEVARQFAGQPMTVDPAGTALVEAVLRVQFSLLAARPALLSRTARAVAGSLLADPAARLSIEHLWATLGEEVA